MAEHRPLTRQERERLHTRIHANVERALAEYDDDDWAIMCMRGLGYILHYEATVAALEAENARLAPLAAVGKAVEGMPVGAVLLRHEQKRWVPFTNGEFFDGGGGWIDMHAYDPWHDREYEEYGHPSAHEALAALRAAKGEGNE